MGLLFLVGMLYKCVENEVGWGVGGYLGGFVKFGELCIKNLFN